MFGSDYPSLPYERILREWDELGYNDEIMEAHLPRQRRARFGVIAAAMAELREVVVVDALRTPIGRWGGALATVRADDLAAFAIRRTRRAHERRSRTDRRRLLGRGQSSRAKTTATSRAWPRCWPGLPIDGSRDDGDAVVRERPAGRQFGRASDRDRLRRHRDRGRRRIDDARAVRDAEGRAKCTIAHRRCSTRRSAGA